MLIEIHMIQNHSPANLNRDDLGAPKTCIFGGVTRARISSQCLKRSIRRSPEFAAALEKDGGVRTRRLATLLARIVGSKDIELTPKKLKTLLDSRNDLTQEEDKLESIARAALELGGVAPRKGKRKDKKSEGEEEEEASEVGYNAESVSRMLLFFATSTIAKMSRDLKEAKKAEQLVDKFKAYIAQNPAAPDIALNGRMTEVKKKSAFSDLNFTVEAALSAAHAISTHAVINEVDYFTAADDVPGNDTGGAYLDEAMFNSACFYKHFVIDVDQLVKNLGGDSELAYKTIRCFLEAAAKANPSGKQHSFAAFNCPDGILVEVKQHGTPVSYANAFADPVPEKSGRGLVGESIARLACYANDLIQGFGIQAERFWFSPNGSRKFAWGEDMKERPVQEVKDCAQFSDFVQQVTDAVKAAKAGAAR